MWSKLKIKDKKRFYQILILSLADLFVFSGVLYIPYILPNFYNYLGITTMQFSLLQALSGFVGLATRIPGGWLADKFNTKKLFIAGLIMTGLLSLMWTITIQFQSNITQNTRFNLYLVVYLGWGVSITGLFWTPLWKLLSRTSKKEDQGQAYGLQGSLVGLFGTIFITGGSMLVAYLFLTLGQEWVFYVFAYFITFAVIGSGIFAIWVIPKYEVFETKQTFKQKLKDLFTPLKFARVWLCAFFVLGMYMFQSTFASSMKDVLARVGISAVLVAGIGGFRSYAPRFLVSSPVGRWSDRWKSLILGLAGFLALGFVAATIFTTLPGYNGWFTTLAYGWQVFIQILLVILFLFIGTIGWILLTLRFVQVSELPMKENSYANTVGAISLIAFSPNAWFNYIKSLVTSNYQEKIIVNGKELQQTSLLGLQILLFIALGFVALGILSGAILIYLNKREMKQKGITDYRWRTLKNQ